MEMIGVLSVPLIMAAIIISGLFNKVKIFDCFTSGAKDGMITVFKIFPSLLGLMVSVYMLKESGVLSFVSNLAEPMLKVLSVPKEVFPLFMMRPVSGSGSLGILSDILSTYGADSYIGKCASVMMGSTETTFYTIAVYYGCINITKTRHTLPCALIADFTGMVIACVVTRFLL